jgi:uncharacterized ferritin-like protein (DUF455 family)
MSITSKRKVVRGVTLVQDPARESCYTVGHTDADMASWFGDAKMSAAALREKLHRHMNNETGALEIAAQCLADFPDAEWELRMCLARQAYDEGRHVSALYRRLRELGGFKGEFPIANFEWCITNLCDTLAARLAIQNRTFEAGQMDLLGTLRNTWRAVGDETTAQVLEHILADEITHVRFANQWIRRMVTQERRLLLKVAIAVRLLADTNVALAAQEGEVNAAGQDLGVMKNLENIAVNVEDRRSADFSDDEIHEILRQNGMSSIAATQGQ